VFSCFNSAFIWFKRFELNQINQIQKLFTNLKQMADQGSMHMKGATDKAKDVRNTNIIAARAVADVVRTSLGPKGMDKMVSIKFIFVIHHNFQIFRSKTKVVKFSLQMMVPPSSR
jgi:hypothetical protein